MPKFTIPYESLDPLTIGAADDDSKVYRDQLELEVADANLLAAIYPDEPDFLPDATAAAAAALESPTAGATFSERIAGGKSVAIVIDNQFRPRRNRSCCRPCSTRSRRQAPKTQS